jgi:hypothetical protein
MSFGPDKLTVGAMDTTLITIRGVLNHNLWWERVVLQLTLDNFEPTFDIFTNHEFPQHT